MREAEAAPMPLPVVLASFFRRLEGMEAINRVILSGARISAELTFRGNPPKTVLLDFSRTPARILVNGDLPGGGTIRMAARAEIMHDVLLDRMPPAVAMSRREMLLRGSAYHLGQFIPLFEFGPVLYREHLTDLGLCGPARPGARRPGKEETMEQPSVSQEAPALPVRLSRLEKILFLVMNRMSYAMGYGMGVLRYRLLKNLNLFRILSSMSRGLAAAMPREDVGEPGQDTGTQRKG